MKTLEALGFRLATCLAIGKKYIWTGNNKGVKMNFVTAKELTIALDSLNEWLGENPDLRLTDIRLGKCTSKEVTFRVEYVDLRKGV